MIFQDPNMSLPGRLSFGVCSTYFCVLTLSFCVLLPILCIYLFLFLCPMCPFLCPVWCLELLRWVPPCPGLILPPEGSGSDKPEKPIWRGELISKYT